MGTSRIGGDLSDTQISQLFLRQINFVNVSNKIKDTHHKAL